MGEIPDELERLIEELEGEVMLCGFYGSDVSFYRDRLLNAYEEKDRLLAAREGK